MSSFSPSLPGFLCSFNAHLSPAPAKWTLRYYPHGYSFFPASGIWSIFLDLFQCPAARITIQISRQAISAQAKAFGRVMAQYSDSSLGFSIMPDVGKCLATLAASSRIASGILGVCSLSIKDARNCHARSWARICSVLVLMSGPRCSVVPGNKRYHDAQ